MTGEIPSDKEVEALSLDWLRRVEKNPLPEYVLNAIDSFPKSLHPMSQFSAVILMLQNKSEFASQYKSGTLKKQNYWNATFEDVNNLISLLPQITSRIYRNIYKKNIIEPTNEVKDWAGRFALTLGINDDKFLDLLRLYLSIHTDHEGGNVSAHTVHLVGSSLSDPYLAFSAGLNGLAGPLHGLANQEVLDWLMNMKKKLGDNPTDDKVEEYLWSCLKDGQVVPGYGHAVLRKTDPRYICQREFALKNMPNDPLFKLTSQLYKLAPKVLSQHGKTKNPWPNVDAHSGVLLQVFLISTLLNYISIMAWSRKIFIQFYLVCPGLWEPSLALSGIERCFFLLSVQKV